MDYQRASLYWYIPEVQLPQSAVHVTEGFLQKKLKVDGL